MVTLYGKIKREREGGSEGARERKSACARDRDRARKREREKALHMVLLYIQNMFCIYRVYIQVH